MSLSRYPTLQRLYDELRALSETPTTEPRRKRDAVNRDLQRLDWGAGSYWLVGPQRRVVAVLLDAYLNSRTPDVPEPVLVDAAGGKARKLAEVFRDSAAWGALVVPGESPATYRLAELPAGPVEDGPRVESE